MTIIKFVQDFRGRETNEAFYKSGDEVDLPDGVATRLVNDGRAEFVKVEVVEAVEVIEPVEAVEEKPFKRGRK